MDARAKVVRQTVFSIHTNIKETLFVGMRYTVYEIVTGFVFNQKKDWFSNFQKGIPGANMLDKYIYVWCKCGQNRFSGYDARAGYGHTDILYKTTSFGYPKVDISFKNQYLFL